MIPVEEYPAQVCECPSAARQWNGYGTCRRCGGAYQAKGDLEPIVVPTASYRAAQRGRGSE